MSGTPRTELRARLRAAIVWRQDRTDREAYADVTGLLRDATVLRSLGPALADFSRIRLCRRVVLGPESRGYVDRPALRTPAVAPVGRGGAPAGLREPTDPPMLIAVRSEPLNIAGLAGPVVVESPFFASRYTVTAGGFPATHIGRKRYALPAAGGGTVETTVSGGFFDAYPTLMVNGVKHRTGPPVPMALRIMAVVPIFIVALGGFLGGMIGALGWAVNMAILRLTLPSAVKVLLMLGVLVVAFLTWSIVVAAVLGGTNT